MEKSKEQEKKISTKQMKSLVFVSLLSPIIRLFPKSSVSIGGKAAWLSPLLALPAVLLIYLIIEKLMKNALPGEGLADVIIKSIGKRAGKAVLMLMVLWLTFYTGFVIKSGAERLISSIYPNGHTGLFTAVITIIGIWIAIGEIRGIGRLAELLGKVIGIILAIIIIVGAFDIKAYNIFPVTVYDIGGVAFGALPVINVLSIGAYTAFLDGYAEKGNVNKKGIIILLTLIITAIMFITVGTLGTKLIESLQHNFFVMIRDMKILGVVERIEAVVIAMWVITDLIYVATLIKICGKITVTITGKKKIKVFSAISGVFALLIVNLIINNAFKLHYLSGIIVPIINMLFIIILLPLILVIGEIRRKKV